jgi:hypothetical protein
MQHPDLGCTEVAAAAEDERNAHARMIIGATA